MIKQESENAKLGLPSEIIAKCNSLEEKSIIEALYEASQAGVKIHLIIRGFCCLRPGVPGLSENISVTSTVGPFLEHSRVFYFRAGRPSDIEGRFFIGSADWMSRNLLGRVEVVAPVEDKLARDKIWEALQAMLSDRRLTWDMDQEGDYALRWPKQPGEEIGLHDLLSEKARLKSIVVKTDSL